MTRSEVPFVGNRLATEVLLVGQEIDIIHGL